MDQDQIMLGNTLLRDPILMVLSILYVPGINGPACTDSYGPVHPIYLNGPASTERTHSHGSVHPICSRD